MDGSSSPEETPIHITEVPRTREDSDVILMQGELTDFAAAEHLKDSQNKAATLQLPIQSPVHRPASAPSAADVKYMSLGKKRVSIVPLSQSPSDADSRNSSQHDVTVIDLFHRTSQPNVEAYTLRPIQNQNAVQNESFPLQQTTNNAEAESDLQLDSKPPLDLSKHLTDRVTRTVQTAAVLLEELEKGKHQEELALGKICNFGYCCSALKQIPSPPKVNFASAVGYKMIPSFFFPAIPKLMEDVWVFLELFITVFGFIFACYSFESAALEIFTLALSLVTMLLAFVDSFLYFIETGSCASGIHSVRKRVFKAKIQSKHNEEENPEEERCMLCHFLSPKQKDFLKKWFQVSRTVITELLLYPLTVADLIELIRDQTYRGGSGTDRINFSLFIIGLFYLILSVYFIRIFMAVSSAVNVKQLPKNTQNNYTTIVAKFCIHVLGQVCVHAIVLVMVGAKVNSEVVACNGTKIDPAGEAEFQVSGFLWYTIVSGDILPFLGIVMFFLVNYTQVKQFSVAFYIDMLSTILTEGFADLLFQGEGVKTAKDKAKQVLGKSQLIETKKEFKKHQESFTLKRRIIDQFIYPHVVLGTLGYFICMATFMVCHVLTVNPCSSDIEFLLFKDDGVTTTFFIGLVVVLLANYQILLLVMCLLLIVAIFVGIVTLFPIIAILLTPVLCTVAAVYFTLYRTRKQNPSDV